MSKLRALVSLLITLSAPTLLCFAYISVPLAINGKGNFWLVALVNLMLYAQNATLFFTVILALFAPLPFLLGVSFFIEAFVAYGPGMLLLRALDIHRYNISWGILLVFASSLPMINTSIYTIIQHRRIQRAKAQNTTSYPLTHPRNLITPGPDALTIDECRLDPASDEDPPPTEETPRIIRDMPTSADVDLTITQTPPRVVHTGALALATEVPSPTGAGVCISKGRVFPADFSVDSDRSSGINIPILSPPPPRGRSHLARTSFELPASPHTPPSDPSPLAYLMDPAASPSTPEAPVSPTESSAMRLMLSSTPTRAWSDDAPLGLEGTDSEDLLALSRARPPSARMHPHSPLSAPSVVRAGSLLSHSTQATLVTPFTPSPPGSVVLEDDRELEGAARVPKLSLAEMPALDDDGDCVLASVTARSQGDVEQVRSAEPEPDRDKLTTPSSSKPAKLTPLSTPQTPEHTRTPRPCPKLAPIQHLTPPPMSPAMPGSPTAAVIAQDDLTRWIMAPNPQQPLRLFFALLLLVMLVMTFFFCQAFTALFMSVGSDQILKRVVFVCFLFGWMIQKAFARWIANKFLIKHFPVFELSHSVEFGYQMFFFVFSRHLFMDVSDSMTFAIMQAIQVGQEFVTYPLRMCSWWYRIRRYFPLCLVEALLYVGHKRPPPEVLADPAKRHRDLLAYRRKIASSYFFRLIAEFLTLAGFVINLVWLRQEWNPNRHMYPFSSTLLEEQYQRFLTYMLIVFAIALITAIVYLIFIEVYAKVSPVRIGLTILQSPKRCFTVIAIAFHIMTDIYQATISLASLDT